MGKIKIKYKCDLEGKRDERPEPPKVKAKVTYPRKWSEYNQAQVHQKAKFMELLALLCETVSPLPRAPGGGRSRLPIQDMVFAVVFKVFECLPGRRFISDLNEAKEKGYITRVPHFNSLFNYLEMGEMHVLLQKLITLSSLPLSCVEVNFAVDSSGFSTGQFTRWLTSKYGKPVEHYSRMLSWVKCHIMCGVSTKIVTAVRATDRRVHDNTQFLTLLEETSRNFTIHNVLGDKAYLSQANLQAVADLGGMAFIPFKPTNRLGDKTKSGSWQAMYYFFHFHRDKFMDYYHKRSNVESAFSMIKAKFGERIRSRTETAKRNEVLCKILCHNISCLIHAMYELGIDPNFNR